MEANIILVSINAFVTIQQVYTDTQRIQPNYKNVQMKSLIGDE